MNRLFKCASGVLTVLWLVGCASIVSKSTYPVSISSAPDAVDISIKNAAGVTVFTGKTPSTVMLKAGAGYFKGENYRVEFTKPGYSTYVAEIKRGVDGWYLFGNFVFGGLVGWFIVDPLTGAMWTLEGQVTGTLSPNSAQTDREPGLRIITLSQVPDSMRAKLVPVQR